ncbi:PH domain-containing protein [Actinoplanes aureus]|uniref:PH domain-containing protein n=1 Tax=Actinoplanes aureus TaxID=2792083 RepID=A0A931C781_9ACTN|nr:PH domain-containing protein [Actinoplanes aureus]MBG0562251.1 PH domain-containing protein [Actinoplanes aureus]
MSDEAWRQLSIRVVHLDLIRVAISLVTGYLGIVLGDDPIWPLVGGACAGLVGALTNLQRWRTTRYRITAQRVEMRSGWPGRRHRTVARDRIRSVSTSANPLPRLLGLATVHIGSGESESSFKLDGLDRRHATRLERELMPGSVLPAVADEVRDPETVIARLRRDWVPLNVVTVWSLFAVAGPLFGLYWLLRPFGVDLLGAARGLLEWNPVLVVAIALPLGVAVTTVTFLVENWNFQLVRKGTAPDTALVTRRGLLVTQTVQRSDERLRGIAFAEPLAWRWLRLTGTKVIATGLRAGGESTTSGVLPRIRLAEARDLAARILPDGSRPLEAALRRHPRGALIRRLGWAVYGPVLAAGALLLYGWSGAIPDWVWPLPLVLLPLTLPAAVVAYLSLGHAVTGDYLVVRGGVLNRRTVALQRRAVIGWTFEQSILQRWGGRMSVGVATAAGSRYYTVPDASVEQALGFAVEATPELARRFIAEPHGPGGGAGASHRG